MALHSKFMAETRLDYSAHGTAEHMTWCKFFEILITYDMLDAGKLASAELGARKIQMIHDRWKHKLPQLGASGGASAGSGAIDDDSFLLLGTYETRGNVGVSPELQQWLGESLSKEALAAKERRKAREERALGTQGQKK
eukprot:10482130-Karenia_brevis.AAC.1